MKKTTILLIGSTITLILLLKANEIKESYNDGYNKGYREGALYAYDNVVICGASPEEEGLRMANEGFSNPTVSNIVCEE